MRAWKSHGHSGPSPRQPPTTLRPNDMRSCPLHTTTSSSSAPAPAAAPWPTASRRPASGSCCSSAVTTCRASRTTGALARSTSRASTRPRSSGATRTARTLHPHTNYCVGGNTKFYGAALFRLRREDFGELRHHGGVSPAWPISYDELEPYYTEAEHLYQVHGERGEDPTEPPRERALPLSRREPRAADPAAERRFRRASGCSPFHVPLGIMLDERNRRQSRCIRCGTCDGHPCLVQAKSDAQVVCVDPALEHPNVTLLTDAYVSRLETSASGREVTRVVVERDGERESYSADIVVVVMRRDQLRRAAASLGERPASARPGQRLGRRGPALHGARQLGADGALHAARTRPSSRRRLAMNDFYFGSPDWDHPDGPHLVRGQAGRRDALGRRARHRAGLDAGADGQALARLLAHVGGSARSREPGHAGPGREDRAGLHAEQR